MFLAYLDDIPEDVVLVAVGLNEQEFPFEAKPTSGFSISEVVHTNNTRGYTLKVPFDHPVVIKQVKYLRNRCSHGSFSMLDDDKLS